MQFFDLFTIILFIVLIGLFALQLEDRNVEKSCVPINFFAPFLIKLMSNFFLICHSLSWQTQYFFCDWKNISATHPV